MIDMDILFIKARCSYVELENSIIEAIKLGRQFDTIIRLNVLVDAGRAFCGSQKIMSIICTISKNSKVDIIKNYVDKQIKSKNGRIKIW